MITLGFRLHSGLDSITLECIPLKSALSFSPVDFFELQKALLSPANLVRDLTGSRGSDTLKRATRHTQKSHSTHSKEPLTGSANLVRDFTGSRGLFGVCRSFESVEGSLELHLEVIVDLVPVLVRV